MIDALNNLSDLHEELLQLARDKQKFVIENRVDLLMTVTAKETKAIAVLERMNGDVERLSGACWAELGLSPKPSSTLADLIQAIHRADFKRSLTEAAERLRRQIGQLKEWNERNQMLVRQSLDYIALQIDLFTAPDDNVTYSSPVKSAPAGTPRRTFDTRA
nr:flagellar protein FlgN [Cohnella sp. CFH 77786]